ncbi:MAG: hypothetical protein J6W30_09325 [Bacteroidales bacterium]|nr:hypothetical protein [Bacteroidales bacterium]
MKSSINVVMVALIATLFAGCDSNKSSYKKQLEMNVGSVPQLTFYRYEDVLFNMDTSRFQQELFAAQAEYRPFLEGDLSNPEAVKFLKDFALDPFSVSLYQKVKAAYPDLHEVKTIVEGVYRHFNYYYPEIQLPEKVFTCVSGVNPDIPAVLFVDDALVISLDWYLNGDEAYERIGMPKYMAERTTISSMAKDLGIQIYKTFIQEGHKQTNLLEEMVFVGKSLFFVEAMCPTISDQMLLGYSDTQMDWIAENEGNVWADLVGNQRLYSSDYDVFRIFFADGPFTNEYSHEAPPRLGEYLGLQIVRSYMNCHECSLPNLMQNTDLQGVFQESKYKPKK